MLKEDIKKFYRNVGTKTIKFSEPVFIAKWSFPGNPCGENKPS
jgi:hypothetical protein